MMGIALYCSLCNGYLGNGPYALVCGCQIGRGGGMFIVANSLTDEKREAFKVAGPGKIIWNSGYAVGGSGKAPKPKRELTESDKALHRAIARGGLPLDTNRMGVAQWWGEE